MFAAGLEQELRTALGYLEPADALLDPRGWTVRCTPRCRTSAFSVRAARLYRKVHRGQGALREWRWLHRLAAAGIAVPEPICVASRRGLSVVVCRAASGRPLDALLRAAAAEPLSRTQAAGFAATVVAPLVRRVHAHGWFHRDLYWNHLFAPSLDAAGVVLLDVERVIQPRWRRRRWIVKDLAGLSASLPAGYSRPARLRFLLAYLGSAAPGWKALARAIERRAVKMRRHEPRYRG